MALDVATLTIDCHDPRALARWWGSALDWKITYETPPEESDNDLEVAIGPKSGAVWDFLFIQVPDEKVVKNRLHLDLRPEDQQAEVDRLLAMGAKKVNVGQGDDVTWVVMADPEGNEFCILRALTPEEQEEKEKEAKDSQGS